MILPIITLVLSLGGLLFAFILQKKTQKGKKKITDDERKVQEQKTAQDFVNVRDIRDIYLYTNDNYVITYIKVQPFSFDLLTENEKKQITKDLTYELSQMNIPFKFIAVSRPIDISSIVEQYNELMLESTDQVQKQLLRSSIMKLNELAMSGDAVQREFYYMLWTDNIEDIYEQKKITKEFLEHFENAGFKGEILHANEIIKLCNLVSNPAYATTEDLETVSSTPFINLLGDEEIEKGK